MDTDQYSGITARYFLLKEEHIDDLSLMQNSYDQTAAKCVIYAKINKSEHLLLIEIDNITHDITLDELVSLFNEKNNFDVGKYLFAYSIYLNNTDAPSTISHNPIFKLFDKSCFVIKDIISLHSNIHLIKNKQNEHIEQKNGLILQPGLNNKCIIDSPCYKNKIENDRISQSLPTVSTINKNISPNVTVLVVEDNPINCKILSKILKKHKIQYKLAKNGLEAIETYCLRRN